VTLGPDALSMALPASTAPITIEVPWPVRAATLDGVAVETSARGAVVPLSRAAGRALRIERD
jgi:hypothetical protein